MSLVYLEYDFKIAPLQPATDILIAELGELGFESFVENETGLLAYILKSEWRDNLLTDLFVFQNPNFEINWTSKEIEQQNWNAEWEKNFHPILVGEKCMVRAPFHEAAEVDYDIVIEPKMSFGTGHHETTHMMLQHILEKKHVCMFSKLLPRPNHSAHIKGIEILCKTPVLMSRHVSSDSKFIRANSKYSFLA